MVYALLADGFEESELIVPIDMLIRGGAQVELVSVDKEVVCGAHGIKISADCHMYDVELAQGDLLFLPGGQPGVDNLWSCKGALDLVMSAAEIGIPIAAICAAPMILGRLGLLEGRRAVCYPGCEGDLHGAIIENAPAVTDGNFITGKAAGAVFPFAVELLKKLGLDADRVMKAVYHE